MTQSLKKYRNKKEKVS